jgi:hypothetical protein
MRSGSEALPNDLADPGLDISPRRPHPRDLVPASTLTAGKGLLARCQSPLAIDAVWLCASPFVLTAGALLTPIRPFDYFWSLVQGRAIVQLGQIPTQNLFLHTLPSQTPFFDQPWLAQLTMYLAYRVGGHPGNLVLLAFLLALAMAITLDTGLRLGGSPRMLGGLALAMSPLLALGAGVRTQMFAYPCFALVLRGVVLASPGRRAGALLPYAVAAALWSNLHGSFVLAPFLFATAWAGEILARILRRESPRPVVRQGLLELSIIALATMANPRGPLSYAYAIRLGSIMRSPAYPVVEEWAAPAFGAVTGGLFYGLAALVLACAIARRAQLDLRAFVPHVVSASLACLSLRFLPWWALSAVIACGRGRAPGAGEERPGPAWVNWGLLALFASVVGLCLPGAPLFARATIRARLPYPEGRVLAAETPLRLAESLATGYPGRLFHTQAVGGLVEWTLADATPRQVAFVDQRFELTPPQLWRDYFAICAARAGWDSLLDRYDVGTLLVDEAEAAGLIARLGDHPAWRLLRRELTYRLYQRVGSPPSRSP